MIKKRGIKNIKEAFWLRRGTWRETEPSHQEWDFNLVFPNFTILRNTLCATYRTAGDRGRMGASNYGWFYLCSVESCRTPEWGGGGSVWPSLLSKQPFQREQDHKLLVAAVISVLPGVTAFAQLQSKAWLCLVRRGRASCREQFRFTWFPGG